MREYIEVKVSSTRSVKGLDTDIGIDAFDASYTKEVNDSAIWHRHVGRLRGSREHRINLRNDGREGVLSWPLAYCEPSMPKR